MEAPTDCAGKARCGKASGCPEEHRGGGNNLRWSIEGGSPLRRIFWRDEASVWATIISYLTEIDSGKRIKKLSDLNSTAPNLRQAVCNPLTPLSALAA